jgi:hypothetical protein
MVKDRAQRSPANVQARRCSHAPANNSTLLFRRLAVGSGVRLSLRQRESGEVRFLGS